LDEVGRIADHLLAANAKSVNDLIQRWIGDVKKDYGGV
jgi:hypothetical protein